MLIDIVLEQLQILNKKLDTLDNPKWLDVKDAAKYLSCSESKIRKLVNTGMIIPKRLGSNQNALLRFSKKQLDLFLITGKSKGFNKQDYKKLEYY